MLKSAIREMLFNLGQEQLSIGLEQLSSAGLEQFSHQLGKYSPTLSAMQKEIVHHPKKSVPNDVNPYLNFRLSGNKEDNQFGEELLRQGKAGCLILAGGQGTRLGFDGPKGSFPISPIKKKSLFQLFCERTRAASLWSRSPRSS